MRLPPATLCIVIVCKLVSAGETFYSLKATSIDGQEKIDFELFRGKVVLLVNVASECGYTDFEYRGLQQLHEDFSHFGRFEILAFPSNQFGQQEPGDGHDILNFVKKKYSVTFELAEKVDVRGKDAHPVWKYLKAQSRVDPEWNFFKYLVNHKGDLIDTFPTGTAFEPIEEAVKVALEEAENAYVYHEDIKEEL